MTKINTTKQYSVDRVEATTIIEKALRAAVISEGWEYGGSWKREGNTFYIEADPLGAETRGDARKLELTVEATSDGCTVAVKGKVRGFGPLRKKSLTQFINEALDVIDHSMGS
jgi:hypothetical protein|tara:strand:+ start:229 stop:567 length:339 start_codon:yes stop_codon:yes gene_type:complete